MATTTISIVLTTPTGVTVAEAVDLYARNQGYQATIQQPDGSSSANPETKAAYAKRIIARGVAESIRTQRIADAKAAAEDAEIAKDQITAD